MSFHILDITEQNKGIVVDSLDNSKNMILWIIKNVGTLTQTDNLINNICFKCEELANLSVSYNVKYEIVNDNSDYSLYENIVNISEGWIWESSIENKKLLKKWSVIKSDEPVNNQYYRPFDVETDNIEVLDTLDCVTELLNVKNQAVITLFPCVNKISFAFDFNEKLKQNFYKKLEYIQFGIFFDQPIDDVNIIENIKTIVLGNNFNNSITYPSTLITIEYGDRFNKSIDTLPDSVENIKLGLGFTQEIKKIPKNLRFFILNNNYDKKISEDIVFSNLVHLKLGDRYNFPLDVQNFPALESVIFGHDYDNDMMQVPLNIKYIKFADHYIGSIDWNNIPNSLETIYVGNTLIYKTSQNYDFL